MRHTYEIFVVIGILIVALFFRFHGISDTPPGLFIDESVNGNNAVASLEDGSFKVFYTENNGREGLFIWLQALSIKIFGPTAWALRVVSALMGTLTVWGTYLLARKLFQWQIAALSSYLLAISFWHVLFSRIGFRAIMAPMLIVWGLYFLWQGLTSTRKFYFVISGVLWGLGFYTYISFRIMPLVVVATLLSYWYATKKDFDRASYRHVREQMIQGIIAFGIAMIIVALPLMLYFYHHPDHFLGRLGQVSALADTSPLQTILMNIDKTLGMFTFNGDYNWRHNIAGQPLLGLAGAFFIIGLIRSIIKLCKVRKSHGHFSTVHVLLLSWFTLGLVPVVLSSEGLPHALRAIIVAPVVFIFAGEGLWWFYEWFDRWYHARDVHEVQVQQGHHALHLKESSAVAGIALLAFLLAMGIVEYTAYFKTWARHPEVAQAFNVREYDIAQKLLKAPASAFKYVVYESDHLIYNGLPYDVQSIVYLTNTATPQKQQAKKIFYISEDDYAHIRLRSGSLVIRLNE